MDRNIKLRGNNMQDILP